MVAEYQTRTDEPEFHLNRVHCFTLAHCEEAYRAHNIQTKSHIMYIHQTLNPKVLQAWVNKKLFNLMNEAGRGDNGVLWRESVNNGNPAGF